MRIFEIFKTIEGEGRYSGCPTIFIRTAYCPVRCKVCDTGFKDKDFITPWQELFTHDIVMKLEKDFPKLTKICLTGGEPVCERDFAEVVTKLAGIGYDIHVETSGIVSIKNAIANIPKKYRPLCSFVVDIKTPSLGCRGSNICDEWSLLQPGHDILKAVISDRNDYEFVKNVLNKYQPKCEVYMSPVHDGNGFPIAKQLAEWMLEDGLHARMQMQMHKVLGVA